MKINSNNPITPSSIQRKNFEPNNKFSKHEPCQDEFIKHSYDKVSFEGLTRTLGKKALDTDRILELIAKYPRSKGYVGSIPSEWIEKIPKSERRKKIKNFYKQFGKIISNLRNRNQTESNILEASAKLNTLMHKTGILSGNQEIRLIEIEKGAFGTGYKFGVEGDPNQYVIKIFHTISFNYTNSGHIVEANRGMFWRKTTENKNTGNGDARNGTQFARFHFADTKNGYMIEQYIGDNKLPPKKVKKSELLGLEIKDTDKAETGHNKKNGYCFDYGGHKITSQLLAENKIVRGIFRKIYRVSGKKVPPEKRTQLWNAIYLNNKKRSTKDVLLGLTESIRLLKPEDRENCVRKLLEVADNDVKKALTDNLRHLPENKTADCFKKLLEGADNKVKKALIDNLRLLPANEVADCFKKLLERADNNVKIALAYKLHYLPANEVTGCFKKLTEGADNKVKKALIDNLRLLPVNKRASCLKILEENNSCVKKLWLTIYDIYQKAKM